MPVSALVFAGRLPSLSPAEFQDYMEKKHIPFLQSIAGDSWPTEHRRKYIARDAQDQATLFAGNQEDINYDVVVELIFEDEAHLQKYHTATLGGPRGAEITEDEHKFIDPATLKIVLLGATTVTKGVP